MRSITHAILCLSAGALLCTSDSATGCAGGLIELVESARGTFDHFVERVIEPVLDEGQRSHFLSISQENDALVMESRDPSGSIYGVYRIEFSSEPQALYPKAGLPEVIVSKTQVKSLLVLPAKTDYSQLPYLQGLVRSMFRADPLLAPVLSPPLRVGSSETVLTYPQRRGLSSLMSYERALESSKPLKLGIFLSSGMGKTRLVAQYIAAATAYRTGLNSEGWKKPPKILAVVENRGILRDLDSVFRKELKVKQAVKFYQDPERTDIDPNAEFIATTRSSYFMHLKEMNTLLSRDPEQPWFVLFDEAHHTGKGDGQFEAILNELEKFIDQRHRIILPSATLRHRDKNIVDGYLGGNVVAPELNNAQLKQLRAGSKLGSLFRTAYFSSVQGGYLSPIAGIDIERMVNENEAIQSVRDKILRDRKPYVPDRGLVFVTTTEEANRYAKLLSELLKEEVLPLHSRRGSSKHAEDWFADRGLHQNTADRHKYLVVVDKFREGIDVPAVNVLVFLRNFGRNLEGLCNFLQNLGRANRNSPRKPGVRIYDYVGYSHWLELGLSGISVESPPGTSNSESPVFFRIGSKTVSPLEFETAYREYLELETLFGASYPTFDLTQFRSDGLVALRRVAAHLGITRWTANFAPRNILIKMAEALPSSEEKEELLFLMREQETWGVADGMQAELTVKPAQRIFRWLFHIGELLLVEQSGTTLTPDSSSTYVDDLARLLFPNYAPLTKLEDWLAFADPAYGALTLLQDEELPRLFPHRGRDFVGQRLMLRLAEELPRGRARTQLQTTLQDTQLFGWNKTFRAVELNGSPVRSNRATDAELGRGEIVTLYRALHALARTWNQIYPKEAVNLALIHTRSEAIKLLDRLFVFRATGRLTEESAARFSLSEGGAIQVLKDWAPLFGVPRFCSDFGPRSLSLALLAAVRELPDCPKAEASALERQLNSPQWEWSRTDGTNLTDARAAQERAYRALNAVFQLYLRTAEGRTFIGLDITESASMERFLSKLAFGFEIHVPDKKTLGEAFLEGATFTALPQKFLFLELKNFWKDFGPKRLYVTKLQSLSSSQHRQRALQRMQDNALWQWSANSGQTALLGAEVTQRSIFLAHIVTLNLAKESGLLRNAQTISIEYALSPKSLNDLFGSK